MDSPSSLNNNILILSLIQLCYHAPLSVLRNITHLNRYYLNNPLAKIIFQKKLIDHVRPTFKKYGNGTRDGGDVLRERLRKNKCLHCGSPSHDEERCGAVLVRVDVEDVHPMLWSEEICLRRFVDRIEGYVGDEVVFPHFSDHRGDVMTYECAMALGLEINYNDRALIKNVSYIDSCWGSVTTAFRVGNSNLSITFYVVEKYSDKDIVIGFQDDWIAFRANLLLGDRLLVSPLCLLINGEIVRSCPAGSFVFSAEDTTVPPHSKMELTGFSKRTGIISQLDGGGLNLCPTEKHFTRGTLKFYNPTDHQIFIPKGKPIARSQPINPN